MTKLSVTASIVAIVILAGPVASFAQSAGGASGSSAGGTAAGSPGAGSAGTGTTGIGGAPSAPATGGGLNNSGNDPGVAGNSPRLTTPPAPGTNSAGTANSSGLPANSAAGVTTGSSTSIDAAISDENRQIDRKLKSICRGC